LGTVVASIFQFLAQPFAPNSSFVPAFSGIGLLCLIIFSYFVLNEKLKAPEIIGIILVVVGTLVFGLNAEDTAAAAVDYGKLALLVGIPLGVFIILAVISHKANHKGHAIIWGSISGISAGLGLALSQTAAISGDRNLIGMLLAADIWIAIVCGQVAFWSTQYGFKHGHASVVVTLYNVLVLMIPILVDIIVLGYTIPTIQIIMLVIILIGAALLSFFRENPQTQTETQPETQTQTE